MNKSELALETVKENMKKEIVKLGKLYSNVKLHNCPEHGIEECFIQIQDEDTHHACTIQEHYPPQYWKEKK